jgi:hypothetical protein
MRCFFRVFRGSSFVRTTKHAKDVKRHMLIRENECLVAPSQYLVWTRVHTTKMHNRSAWFGS